MIRELRPALSLVLLFTLVLGFAAPAAIAGLAHLVFPFEADGSLLRADGRIVGSALIGQNFTGAGYFHGRPSSLTGTDATGKTIPTPYDAAESGGSNLASTSKALAAEIAARAVAYRHAFGPGPVPAEAVESSASGLDPDISLIDAMRQAPAVAAARHLPASRTAALVNRLARRRFLGFIGTDHVNVLRLNLALETLAQGSLAAQ